jgi:hypothetical protein
MSCICDRRIDSRLSFSPIELVNFEGRPVTGKRVTRYTFDDQVVCRFECQLVLIKSSPISFVKLSPPQSLSETINLCVAEILFHHDRSLT